MRRPYLVGRYLRQSPTTYQSLLNKPPHDGCHILKPDHLIDAMQVIQVDIIRAKSAHGIFKMPTHFPVEIRPVRLREFTNMKFGGKHHLFTERLDSFTDLDDALLYMQENFEWDPDSEGVQLLVDLLERKLS